MTLTWGFFSRTSSPFFVITTFLFYANKFTFTKSIKWCLFQHFYGQLFPLELHLPSAQISIKVLSLLVTWCFILWANCLVQLPIFVKYHVDLTLDLDYTPCCLCINLTDVQWLITNKHWKKWLIMMCICFLHTDLWTTVLAMKPYFTKITQLI